MVQPADDRGSDGRHGVVISSPLHLSPPPLAGDQLVLGRHCRQGRPVTRSRLDRSAHTGRVDRHPDDEVLDASIAEGADVVVHQAAAKAKDITKASWGGYTVPNYLDPVTRDHIERGLIRLHQEFAGIFSTETIDRYLAESTEALSGSRVPNFLPLFVNRFASERLRALAQVDGKLAKAVPEILFVCVHNSGRSQMAAALLNRQAHGRVHVSSAGSAPAEEIEPVVVSAMAEVGLDVTQEFPKPITDEVARAADVIVTMGCGDACPIYPGKRYLDWDLPTPAGQSLEFVRSIRDDLNARVATLLRQVVPAHT